MKINRDDKPQFIEGNVFKTIIPVGITLLEGAVDGAVDGAIDGAVDEAVEEIIEGITEGITEGIKGKLKYLLLAIFNNEGKRIPFYAEIISEPDKNIERYIRILKSSGIIAYEGSKKTGGYFLTKKMKAKLK